MIAVVDVRMPPTSADEGLAEARTNGAIGRALVIGAGAVEKHMNSIFTKLGLPPSGDDHRRVLAVVAWPTS